MIVGIAFVGTESVGIVSASRYGAVDCEPVTNRMTARKLQIAWRDAEMRH